MRNLNTIICTLLLLFISNLAISQTFENFEKLVVNEWVLEKYEMNGEVLPPKERHEDDRMIFTKDYVSKSISHGVAEIGTWKFDTENAIFSVSSNRNDSIDFRVISISENLFILEMETPQKQKVTLHLISDK